MSRHETPSQPPRRGRGRRGERFVYRNRTVFVPEGYLAVGMITGPHGIRGEVKVELHTDFPERFAPGAILYLGESLQEVEILQARPHKGQYLLLLAGIHERNTADNLRGQWLFIPESQAAELDEDTYWVHDIIGLRVQTEEGRYLGVVQDVLETGANDVYVVDPPADVNQGRPLLLPAIAEVIQAVDLATGIMTIRLMAGLLDE